MFSKENLQELSNTSIKTINHDNLRELSNIQINTDMPVKELIEDFFNQIGNPYSFLVNGIPVQISYNNHNKTIDDCLYSYLTDKMNLEN